MKILPLEIRDVSPHPDAVLLTGQNADGLTSGVHTGGAWLWRGEVWKPLDARPYMNAPSHVQTDAIECLLNMEGTPLFPHNWRVEERNGRQFVVRKKGVLLMPDDLATDQDLPYSSLSKVQLLEIEMGIRGLNQKGWELNESSLPLAMGDSLYIYDLSAAQRMPRANELGLVRTLFVKSGNDVLARLRIDGKDQVWDLTADNFEEKMRLLDEGYVHVYRNKDGWTVSRTLLEERDDLEWAWSPIDTPIQDIMHSLR